MTRAKAVLLLLFVGSLGGCGSSQRLNLTGTWLGTVTDPVGSGVVTWTIGQTGELIEGLLVFTDARTNATFVGTVSGSLSGGTLAYIMVLSFGSCSVTVGGPALASPTRIAGSYSGSNTCNRTAIGVGELKLSRQ